LGIQADSLLQGDTGTSEFILQQQGTPQLEVSFAEIGRGGDGLTESYEGLFDLAPLKRYLGLLDQFGGLFVVGKSGLGQ
jgi:hypothetical protein